LGEIQRKPDSRVDDVGSEGESSEDKEGIVDSKIGDVLGKEWNVVDVEDVEDLLVPERGSIYTWRAKDKGRRVRIEENRRVFPEQRERNGPVMK